MSGTAGMKTEIDTATDHLCANLAELAKLGERQAGATQGKFRSLRQLVKTQAAAIKKQTEAMQASTSTFQKALRVGMKYGPKALQFGSMVNVTWKAISTYKQFSRFSSFASFQKATFGSNKLLGATISKMNVALLVLGGVMDIVHGVMASNAARKSLVEVEKLKEDTVDVWLKEDGSKSISKQLNEAKGGVEDAMRAINQAIDDLSNSMSEFLAQGDQAFEKARGIDAVTRAYQTSQTRIERGLNQLDHYKSKIDGIRSQIAQKMQYARQVKEGAQSARSGAIVGASTAGIVGAIGLIAAPFTGGFSLGLTLAAGATLSFVGMGFAIDAAVVNLDVIDKCEAIISDCKKCDAICKEHEGHYRRYRSELTKILRSLEGFEQMGSTVPAHMRQQYLTSVAEIKIAFKGMQKRPARRDRYIEDIREAVEEIRSYHPTFQLDSIGVDVRL